MSLLTDTWRVFILPAYRERIASWKTRSLKKVSRLPDLHGELMARCLRLASCITMCSHAEHIDVHFARKTGLFHKTHPSLACFRLTVFAKWDFASSLWFLLDGMTNLSVTLCRVCYYKLEFYVIPAGNGALLLSSQNLFPLLSSCYLIIIKKLLLREFCPYSLFHG